MMEMVGRGATSALLLGDGGMTITTTTITTMTTTSETRAQRWPRPSLPTLDDDNSRARAEKS